MITYAYWVGVLAVAAAILQGLGMKSKKWKPAAAISVLILAIGWGASIFHYQQIFVKRYGGVMSISVPDGQFHMGATWKDDNLWIKSSVNIPRAICWKTKSLSGIATR